MGQFYVPGEWTARTQTRPQERGLGTTQWVALYYVLYGGVLHTLCNLLFIDLLFNLVMWMDQFLTLTNIDQTREKRIHQIF